LDQEQLLYNRHQGSRPVVPEEPSMEDREDEEESVAT